MISLNKNDLDVILQSLEYTKQNFENSQQYPSYEFKQQRLEEVNAVISKIQGLKKETT